MFDRPAIKKEARLRMREHKPSVYIVTIVFLAISVVLSIIESKLSGAESMTSRVNDMLTSGIELDLTKITEIFEETMSRITPFASILTLAIGFVTAVIEAGYARFSLNVWRQDLATVGTLFDEFSHFFKIVWLNILMGIFIFLWSLLLVFPGIIAAYRYRFAIYVLIENPEMRAIECIRESKRLTQGHKGELFVLDLSFIGWILVGAVIAWLVGTITDYSINLFDIWLMPYMQIATAGYYAIRKDRDLNVNTEAFEL